MVFEKWLRFLSTLNFLTQYDLTKLNYHFFDLKLLNKCLKKEPLIERLDYNMKQNSSIGLNIIYTLGYLSLL